MNRLAALLALLLLLTLWIAVPFAIAWSLNVVFNAGVPYTLEVWIAIQILLISVNGFSVKVKKDGHKE